MSTLRSRINAPPPRIFFEKKIRPPAVIRTPSLPSPRLLIFAFSSLAPKKFEHCQTSWEISNGKDSLYAYFVETDPFMVQFFEPKTGRGDTYRLNDVKFAVVPEDFVRKVKDPHLVAVGRSRVNYGF